VVGQQSKRNERIKQSWSSLRAFLITIGAGTLTALGERQVRILSDLLLHPSRASIARFREIRRDTLDKKIGVIRERLGLENHHQLMGTLSSMQARNHTTLPRDQGKEGDVPLGKESH
jgi:hypothetical protein